jgi:hypothetical protein
VLVRVNLMVKEFVFALCASSFVIGFTLCRTDTKPTPSMLRSPSFVMVAVFVWRDHARLFVF